MDWVDYREKLGIGFCDEEKFKFFKTIIFNALNIAVNNIYSGCIDVEEYYAFCNTTGLSLNLNYGGDMRRERFAHCLSVIEKQKTLNEFLAYYVALTNSVKTEKYFEQAWTRARFAELLCDKLTQAHIPFDLLEDEEEYFIFPKGAAELDDALVSQPLHWLSAYPNTRKAFVKALKEYADANSDNASEIADKFRKALETFFQEFFGGNKSLDNYKNYYGTHLKSHGISKEISGNFETLLQSYANYINNYAKHRDATSDTVLEYLMYQTGNIMRLLITLK